MLVPFKCPVCDGRGNVPHGFYDRLEGAASTEPEPCRACDAKGIILQFASDPFPIVYQQQIQPWTPYKNW